MGMSSHVYGFKPMDKQFEKMLAAYKACEDAGVEIPDEVDDYFDNEPPDTYGKPIHLGNDYECEVDGVEIFSTDDDAGFQINLDKIDPAIRIIRFVNSW